MILFRIIKSRNVLYACFIFIIVNMVLYFKTEDDQQRKESFNTKNPKLKTKSDPEEFVMGLADPLMLIENTLTKHHITDEYPHQLWPDESRATGDRIIKQLDFLGYLTRHILDSKPRMTPLSRVTSHPKDKIVLVTSGVKLAPWEMKREKLIRDQCPITNCYFVEDLSRLPKGLNRPDAVVYKGAFNALKRVSEQRTKEEIWIVYQLESPLYSSMGKFSQNQLPNWTATYRTFSTIVTPYEKYVPFSLSKNYEKDGDSKFGGSPDVNYGARKTKLIAWFVTNCKSQSTRLSYAKELQKYISVDIYGGCGTLKCPKNDDKCLEMLKTDYKFYLSFENSNCREYISEKFYDNAIANDVVPIVMGAHPDDYRAMAPPHSYIHVDDFASPRDLAVYLHQLNKNDTLYNEYFKWKGTGSFINTKFWCRLCAMLHARDKDNYVHWYPNIHQWWFGDDVCVHPNTRHGWSSWRPQPEDKALNLSGGDHTLSSKIKNSDNKDNMLKL